MKSPGPQVTLVLGDNKYGGATGYAHGQAWAQMVNSVANWIGSHYSTSQLHVAGGSDMEVEWDGPSATQNWVNGYNATASYTLYDYGDDSGGTNPGNGWGAWDVWDVAYGARLDVPVPEIYYTQDATDDWQPLSLWAYNNENHKDIYFEGDMTEYAVDSSTLTPSEGWNTLYNALSSSTYTAQADLNYATDITKNQ